MYVVHWNIFMVNKRDLQQKRRKQKAVFHTIVCHAVQVMHVKQPYKAYIYILGLMTGIS